MKQVGGYRNFGWGKQMEWAGKQALRAAFDGGHYATVASHGARWRRFCTWAREQGVRDVRQITPSEVAQFATHLRQQTDRGMSIGYAKNQLTSVNVALESLRGDRRLWVRPGDFLGRRSGVRAQAPAGLERDQLKQAIGALAAAGRERVAAVALLCRELGLRRREACLLDLRLAKLQAVRMGRVNVIAGTKGGRGRSVDRWVPVGPAAMRAIEAAVRATGTDPRLVPTDQKLAHWLTHVSQHWSNVAQPLGLGPLRDLRSAYACERYAQLSGAPAPVVAGERVATKEDDTAARQVLSQELGHQRTEVIGAYVGSSR